ncbi:MAG: uncharacterized protein KVP18_002217 [Porospora cf. gigantea A]|uniref:uncharacterized protein n=1 Tax=Porospora cf. gigantea A TaxID=2853593 RepID=UPI00355A2F93|nr:MAG: hypothetical protein KVP18_002217 [Porospora cf. gigantea A]
MWSLADVLVIAWFAFSGAILLIAGTLHSVLFGLIFAYIVIFVSLVIPRFPEYTVSFRYLVISASLIQVAEICICGCQLDTEMAWDYKKYMSAISVAVAIVHTLIAYPIYLWAKQAEYRYTSVIHAGMMRRSSYLNAEFGSGLGFDDYKQDARRLTLRRHTVPEEAREFESISTPTLVASTESESL